MIPDEVQEIYAAFAVPVRSLAEMSLAEAIESDTFRGPAEATPDGLPAEHVDVFVDLARRGKETDFMALAGTLGLEGADDMWRGTRARLGFAAT